MKMGYVRCPVCGDDAYAPTERDEQVRWWREIGQELIELGNEIEGGEIPELM